MLTPFTQSKLVQRILTNEAGERFRVLFLVGLENGQLKAHIVSAEYLPQTETEAVLCLPLVAHTSTKESPYVPSFAYRTPFSSLSFFISQPTRGPNL